MSSFEVPEAVIKKCVKCRNYLSVPPVVRLPDGVICGRCVPVGDESGVREELYEELAQQALFPCRYDSTGCPKKIKFDQVRDHELSCCYKSMKCPAVFCNAEITQGTIEAHFLQQHKEVVFDAKHIKLPTIGDVISGLTFIQSEPFILLMFLDSERLNISVQSFKESGRPFEMFIKSESSSMQLTKAVEVKQLIESILDTDWVGFKVKELKELLGDELILGFKSQGADIEALDELECFVCGEFMGPPIYLCKTGHSLCCTCKEQLTLCPLCKSGYDGGRNYVLEKLCQRREYQCRYQGCVFTGPSETVAEHSTVCTFAKRYECPVKLEYRNCAWGGFSHEIYPHVEKAHPRAVFELKARQQRKLQENHAQSYYIVRFDNNIFKLYIKQDKGCNVVTWAMFDYQLGASAEPRYEFVLNFLDQSKSERVLTGNFLCYSMENVQASEVFIGSGAKFTIDLLTPFIQHPNLWYQLNVKRLE